jgi:hypothetical protein
MANTGELTVREYSVEISYAGPPGYWVSCGTEAEARFRPSLEPPGQIAQIDAHGRLFPGQVKPLGTLHNQLLRPTSFLFIWERNRSSIDESCKLYWRVFLDDAVPTEGAILLADGLAKAFASPEPTFTPEAFDDDV